MLTVTDQFCGAGGSSIGASQAGLRLRLALNHWPLAIETHNTNFPDADHDCTDVSACDPRRYPSTDILLTSPECTNHSLAKGARRRPPQEASLFDDEKPLDAAAAERSRATMWDVVRFAELHRYRAIVVENVVDAYNWGPNDNGALFQAWLSAMHALGYRHRCVFYNSMFAPPTPQSRDRMYVVFWREGQLAPDLDFTVTSYCWSCERVVEGRQAWKKPTKPWGRFSQQYVYTCPDCHDQVTPYAHAAASAIDWTMVGQRIGDRTRPLAKATMDRIKRGVEKYGLIGMQMRTLGDGYGGDPRPLTLPFLTQTTRTDIGMLLPVAANRFERTPGSRVDLTDGPFRTMTGTSDRALVVPMRNHGVATPAELDALPTVCAAGNHHGLLVSAGGPSGTARRAREVNVEPMPTMLAENHNAFVTRHNGTKSETGWESTPVDEPFRTLTTHGHQSLTTIDVDAFIDDCTFRMLQPHEIAKAMQMHEHHDGSEYVVLGTKREKVQQYGNAVTPPVMRRLLERVVESLEPAGIARAA